MLPRKPQLGEPNINESSENLSDDDVRTQSDEGLLADKQHIPEKLPVCYSLRRWCGCIVSREVSDYN